MRYKLLEVMVIPVWDEEGAGVVGHKWKVFVKHLTEDCHERKCDPDPAGFIYFPEGEDASVAFNKLKDFLMEKHRAEIRRLEDSLTQLQDLEM